MTSELVDDAARQRDPPVRSAGLRRARLKLAGDLGHDLGDLNRTLVEIHPAVAKPGQLANAQSAEGTHEDQRPVATIDRRGQPRCRRCAP
jgi:hypothetical protein